MRIITVTFHGAHNFGSMLQAYALQTYIQKLCNEYGVDCEYKILNYRSDIQKKIYGQRIRDFKGVLKWFMRLPYYRKLQKKGRGFENFLEKYLNLTYEISEEEDLREYAEQFDCYLSGSDQIWNIRSQDFSFIYLLDFTEKRKISYAASLGPLSIKWEDYFLQQYENLLKKYDYISVREPRSKEQVDKILNSNKCEVHVDPTLLLSVDEWRNIQSDKNYNDGNYIFFYCLEPTKNHLKIAKSLSRQYGLPIVIDGYRSKYDYFNDFVKIYDAGPLEFLSLIDNAKMVLTSSFHGTAFSIIYQKPFWVIDGMRDARIRNLLKITKTQDNNIDITNIKNNVFKHPIIAKVEGIQKERQRSKKYLIEALELTARGEEHD